MMMMLYSDAEALHAQQSAGNFQRRRLSGERREEDKEGKVETRIRGNSAVISLGYFLRCLFAFLCATSISSSE